MDKNELTPTPAKIVSSEKFNSGLNAFQTPAWLTTLQQNKGIIQAMETANRFKPPAWLTTLQQNKGIIQAMETANRFKAPAWLTTMQQNSGIIQAMETANRFKAPVWLTTMQQNSGIIQAMETANRFKAPAWLTTMQQNSGIIQAMETANRFKTPSWIITLQQNNEIAQAIESRYQELNTTIAQAIDEFEKDGITEKTVENLYHTVAVSVLSFVNIKRIPRDFRFFIAGIIVSAFFTYISLAYSKQLSDSSTEQLISQVDARIIEIINNTQSTGDKIIDTIVECNNKLVNLLNEPYVTVHPCKVFETAKFKIVKNQIGEGVYVHLTSYQLGSKVFINYATEDCPEEPQSGWINKKYIKKESLKPKKKDKLFPIRKSE